MYSIGIHTATETIKRLALMLCSLLVLSGLMPLQLAHAQVLNVSGNSIQVDRQATETLILATSDVNTLGENILDIIASLPHEDSRLDNELLRKEMYQRFYAAWPTDEIGEFKWVTSELKSARVQVICWLAECNKRMLIDSPDLRAQLREAIQREAKNILAQVSDPDEMLGLLDTIARTVFYTSAVVPSDDTDGVIDLFKHYVGNPNPSIHEFARQRLRFMGYAWHPRYEEIRQFLIEEAPEIKNVLTADPQIARTVGADILTGWGIENRIREQEWLAIDRESPEALGKRVESTLSDLRSTDSLSSKALSKLIIDATYKEDEASCHSLAKLVRKGIRPWTPLYKMATFVSNDIPDDKRETVLSFLDELIQSLLEADSTTWPRYSNEPGEILERLLSAVDEEYAKREEDEETRSRTEPAFAAVKQRLGNARVSLESAD